MAYKYNNPNLLINTCNLSDPKFRCEDILNVVYKLTFLADMETQVKLLDYSYLRNYKEFFDLIDDPKRSLFHLDINTIDKTNSLHRLLFVSHNLSEFLSQLKLKEYSISGGPQSHRAELNTMNSFLGALDMEFRDDLFKHYLYHLRKGSHSSSSKILGRHHFNYQNIHCNLGDIRF